MNCLLLDCGDGIERVCPPSCPPGYIDFRWICPHGVQCEELEAMSGALQCAAAVPCTEAGSPVGACLTPFEQCSPSPPPCPTPRSVCGSNHVWSERAPRDCRDE